MSDFWRKQEAYESQRQAEAAYRAISERIYEVYKDGKLLETFSDVSEARKYRKEIGKCRIHKIERSKSDPEHIFEEEDMYAEYETVALSFSEFIVKYLAATNKTMKTLAEELELPYRTIQDWKAGRRTPSKFIQKSICAKFSEVLSDYCLYEKY